MQEKEKKAAVLAPSGTLRAAINLGNAVLAGVTDKGALKGVTVDLARRLASELGVPLELIACQAARESVALVSGGKADVGFFAIDPQRSGSGIAFTEPYVLIEGCYAVRRDSPLQANADVDAEGIDLVVGQGSAYDLHLSRTLRHARLVRAPSPRAVLDIFLEAGYPVMAGVRQQLEKDRDHVPGLRLLPGHFMVIPQAMGVPQARGQEALAYLQGFIESCKLDGFVVQSLDRHGMRGVSVAPVGEWLAA
ncbi:ABC transporter substrate-binding protein [Bordetella sp. J329]|uniref:transporter substrate-binding domain-containing protein n=1 Tax=Kerstersia gyiorum TaxID=206506 RepID=UPI000FD8925C|nr:transporter substrate-binding domain-containing protein [Kerstersia gyiorum]AZV93932.1 ABC transporter substrate-binding protein [Bordetella sp. J329]MCH4272531.1 transporter substrate-binding domain-containing protein [Kerstersia gyiorum]